MSTSKPKPKSDETTILHLSKFAPPSNSSATAPATPAPPAEEGLTVFIQKAAAETAGETQPVGVSKESPLPAKDLLGAVSYCYAKGVYESDRIERKMLNDPELRAQLGEQTPSAGGIRRFRRLNRAAIVQTLEKAFRLKRRQEKLDLLKPLPGQPPSASVPQAVLDGDSTVFLSKQQAEQKVQNAAIIDNMSKE